MKQINSYIIEKLVINKNSESDDSTGLKFEHEIDAMFPKGPYDYEACKSIISHYNKKETLEQLYVELMIRTNSIPVKSKNSLKIFSYPANLGQHIITKLREHNMLDPDDIMNAYNDMYDVGGISDIEAFEMFPPYEKFLNNRVEYLLKNGGFKHYSFNILFEEGENVYSSKAKDMLSQGVHIYCIPFDLIIENKRNYYITLRCEVDCSESRYLYTYLEGMRFDTLDKFYNAVNREL